LSPMRRGAVGVGGAIFLLCILSCLTAGIPLASAQAAGSVSVSIPSGAGSSAANAPGYSPDSITVVIGVNNTVVWTNDDGFPHTVTSQSTPAGAAAFDSGLMGPGDTFAEVFTVPGTYRYICTYHSWMSGTVVVEASTSSTSTSTQTTPEFPATWLPLIFVGFIAASVLVARLRPFAKSAP